MIPKKIAITGIGAITPIGNTIATYSANLLNGISGAQFITKFDASKFRTRFACEIKEYNPENYFEKKEIRKYDLCIQYGLIAAEQAIQQAQLNSITINKNRVGVIFSSGIGGVNTIIEEMNNYRQRQNNPKYFSPYFVTKTLIDSISGLIAIKHGFKAANYAVVAACASSSYAIINAIQQLQLNRADIIVVGGAEAPIHEAGIGGFNAMRALSENNDAHTQASRPFDRNRDGFVIGEGGGAMILETLEHAQQRDVPILATIEGYSTNADAYHATAPEPNAIAISENMQMALNDAQITAKDIDYINAHATATPLGDTAELKGILNVFKDNLAQLNISATKSMTGHLLGAAGIVESIASVVTIQTQCVPPTINFTSFDDTITADFNITPNVKQERNINYVLSNNFGFGGHNASIIFKKNSEK